MKFSMFEKLVLAGLVAFSFGTAVASFFTPAAAIDRHPRPMSSG
jgi:hypothetical protein